ncbi:uroporphyrinogen decarboxylase family protein [Flexilinea flocculi]|jgi:uroporphyrinogen decarboxylase|uniref:Uroporphyrinogen decarboxylase n=1 Tax=Flexilinea flocculi TaxID=1678840 RepID=A0A0S7BQK4_9CHLR|nr:uroporphyrinogen decarboxylase family protein [Flexilinea flocculi]GAP40050.1 uroporphyrinogen decarboxylase [Flexilinea flocculi]
MNSRERLQMALNHQEPDLIPSDLGATVLTSINQSAYTRLRRYLGLPDTNVRIRDQVQQIVTVDDDVRDHFRVDVSAVVPNDSDKFHFEIKTDMDRYTYFYDEWGIGWKMPKIGGLYYDMFDHPLKGDFTKADVDHYPWPDPGNTGRFKGMREQAYTGAFEKKQGVIISSMSAGILELAAWMRGFENCYRDFCGNSDCLEYLLDKIVELKMAYWEKALAEAGEFADAVVEADDMAGQNNMLISPNTYRKFVKPRHKKLFDFIKSRTNAKIFFHSCGSVRKVIGDLIDVGVDILNPVQVSAVGMDSAELKKEFGADLTFWGGAVDTQRVLGTGSVQDVKDDVRRRIDDLAPGGGFVFAAVHNIQANVPPENIVAMWDTLHEYGIYSS